MEPSYHMGKIERRVSHGGMSPLFSFAVYWACSVRHQYRLLWGVSILRTKGRGSIPWFCRRYSSGLRGKSAGLEQYCCDSSHTTYGVGKRVRKSHNNQYQIMNAILIHPSTGRIWTRSMLQTSATLSLRTLELERVRASSAKKKRKQRHRQPPLEQQQKPRAQQQEPYQRVEGIETKQSITDSSSFRGHWRESRLTVATAVADASHVETGHGFATPQCQASVRGDENPIAQIEHSWVLG